MLLWIVTLYQFYRRLLYIHHAAFRVFQISRQAWTFPALCSNYTLQQPIYQPDLAPSNFSLFQNQKQHLKDAFSKLDAIKSCVIGGSQDSPNIVPGVHQ